MGLVRRLADELSSFAFFATLSALSPALLRRAGPRALRAPGTQFPASALARLRTATWRDEDWCSLMLNGTLASPEALVAGPPRPTPSPSPYARAGPPPEPPLLAAVVHAGERLVLSADLWSFQTAGTAPLAPVGRGSVGAAGGGAWALPRPYGAAAPAPTIPRPTGRTSYPPTGYTMALEGAVWEFWGVPSGAAYAGALGEAQRAQGVHAFRVPGAGGGSSAHAVVEAGALRPGLLYAVTLTAQLNVSWAFEGAPRAGASP